MSGWQDWIFGNLPPPPARPTSRAAMPGLQPYQQMPDAKSTITDQRSDPIDYATEMRKEYPGTRNYAPSISGGANQAWSDPMLDAGQTLSEGISTFGPNPYDFYKDSFKQNWKPSPYNRPAPYNPFRLPAPYGDEFFGTGQMGPNLPRGPQGTSVDPEMPYMGAHLPISPGDPGWTPPPSQSGPHNPQGDPDRPGYGSPVMPMDLSSAPGVNASQPSYQQLINFLQSRGGAS